VTCVKTLYHGTFYELEHDTERYPRQVFRVVCGDRTKIFDIDSNRNIFNVKGDKVGQLLLLGSKCLFVLHYSDVVTQFCKAHIRDLNITESQFLSPQSILFICRHVNISELEMLACIALDRELTEIVEASADVRNYCFYVKE